MKFRWVFNGSQTEAVRALADRAGVSPLLAQCLINRNLSDPERAARFLEPRLKYLADPFLLPNMDKAVERLAQARTNGERLVIFGDYDVDGVTSTALLTEALTKLGWKVEYYLPHRIEEGYGLSEAGVENCLKKHPVSLLLAVDCGSSSGTVIRALRAQRVDVVVLDHHQVAEAIPEAVALVNPQLAPEDHPSFRELCSVGLAFKLVHALVKRGRAEGLAAETDFDLRPYLDLVALGTIADLVPLTGENRILTSAGLLRLNESARPGIIALKEVARIGSSVGSYEVGFQLGPRLNAAGRIENALKALDLLLTQNHSQAKSLAEELDSANRQRQEMERQIFTEAVATVRSRFDPTRNLVVVEGQQSWHIGVVGIVASRVLQEFYRPTIIVGGDGGYWRGSGRSIDGFDLTGALRECKELLIRHGGHAMAAGVTLAPDKLESLRERLNEVARRMIPPEKLQPSLRIDAEVTLKDMTFPQIRELEKLEQTGIGNPQVQFVSRNVRVTQAPQRFGAEKKHLRFKVSDGAGTQSMIWWNAPEGANLPPDNFDVAFTSELNEYNGTLGIQLRLLDWRVT